MNRWGARMAGVILLLVFSLMLLQMYKTLKAIEREQRAGSSSR
jgi:uncharacterized membrane protein YjfL (UPF0719 family)